MDGKRRLAIAAAAALVLGVVVLLLLPTHPEQVFVTAAQSLLPHDTRLGDLLIYVGFELLGNIALFVPVGAIGAVLLGGRRGLVAAVAVSAGCELAQNLVPGRHASLTDVVLNATGAALGVAAVVLQRRTAAARQARRARPQEAHRQ